MSHFKCLLGAPLRRCALWFAAALLMGQFLEASAVGALITARYATPRTDPSNPQIWLTPLDVGISLDPNWIDFSIELILPATPSGLSLSFVTDPDYDSTVTSILRHTGLAGFFGPFPMGIFHQPEAYGDNLPSSLTVTVILTETYYDQLDRKTVTTSSSFQLGIQTVPEPTSLASAAMAVLGVGGFLTHRRWIRGSA